MFFVFFIVTDLFFKQVISWNPSFCPLDSVAFLPNGYYFISKRDQIGIIKEDSARTDSFNLTLICKNLNRIDMAIWSKVDSMEASCKVKEPKKNEFHLLLMQKSFSGCNWCFIKGSYSSLMEAKLEKNSALKILAERVEKECHKYEASGFWLTNQNVPQFFAILGYKIITWTCVDFRTRSIEWNSNSNGFNVNFNKLYRDEFNVNDSTAFVPPIISIHGQFVNYTVVYRDGRQMSCDSPSRETSCKKLSKNFYNQLNVCLHIPAKTSTSKKITTEVTETSELTTEKITSILETMTTKRFESSEELQTNTTSTSLETTQTNIGKSNIAKLVYLFLGGLIILAILIIIGVYVFYKFIRKTKKVKRFGSFISETVSETDSISSSQSGATFPFDVRSSREEAVSSSESSDLNEPLLPH